MLPVFSLVLWRIITALINIRTTFSGISTTHTANLVKQTSSQDNVDICQDNIVTRQTFTIQHEHNGNVSAMTNIKLSLSGLESFNVFEKETLSDLSIYFLKENLIYSLRCAGTKYGNREEEER